jgi:hypothetical protein
MSVNRRVRAGAPLVVALLVLAASASAHTFKWDGSAPDPKRPGVTLRWDRTLAACGDTSPFRTMKVRAHQGQTKMLANQYLTVTGRRQVRSGGRWVSLPSSSDSVTKRAPNGRATAHYTLQFYLRFVDKGMRSRVQLRYAWMEAAGEAGDKDDKLWAKRTLYTSACKIP